MVKVRQVSWKLQKMVAAIISMFTLGSLGILGEAVQGQQDKAIPSDSLTNGTYLYGEVPQPNQVGKGYVLFQHQQNKVMGAFYYPLSEFDCFTGSLNNKTLDLVSVGAYDVEVVRQKINLSDLEQIGMISANDRRILSICMREAATLRTTSLNYSNPYCGKQLER